MPRKPAMSSKMRESASRAIERHRKRPITPDFAIDTDNGQLSYSNPYRAADELGWCALMLDAFGTRQVDVANVFVVHLAHLCSSQWDAERSAWRPREQELQTAIAIVRDLGPRNTAEAALAAQAVAVHFAAMKLAQSAAERSHTDPRTMAALAALGRTYAIQIEAMQRLKGKRTSKHKITVRNERHVHHHQHVSIGRGSANSGGQPCGTGTRIISAGSALPSLEAVRPAVPIASGER